MLSLEYAVTLNLVKGWFYTKGVRPAPGSLTPNTLLVFLVGPTISHMPNIAVAKLQAKLIWPDGVSENKAIEKYLFSRGCRLLDQLSCNAKLHPSRRYIGIYLLCVKVIYELFIL